MSAWALFSWNWLDCWVFMTFWKPGGVSCDWSPYSCSHYKQSMVLKKLQLVVSSGKVILLPAVIPRTLSHHVKQKDRFVIEIRCLGTWNVNTHKVRVDLFTVEREINPWLLPSIDVRLNFEFKIYIITLMRACVFRNIVISNSFNSEADMHSLYQSLQ